MRVFAFGIKEFATDCTDTSTSSVRRLILPSAEKVCHGGTEEYRKCIYPCKSVQSVANKNSRREINILPLAKKNLPRISQINTDFLFASQIDTATDARKAQKLFSDVFFVGKCF